MHTLQQSAGSAVASVLAAVHPTGRINTLENYLAKGYHTINGWLHETAVHATLAFADIQRSFVKAGPVCEIGVWEGRYLALLSFLSGEPQAVIGVDPFIHSGDRDRQIARLYQNINAFFHRPKLVRVLQKQSRDVSDDELIRTGGDKFQFVSVDGDHTMAGCLHDLHLADRVLAPGGIVAVDDILNVRCPGVIESMVRYSLGSPTPLAPIAIIGNKLFLTQRAYHKRYRNAFLEKCRSGELGEASQRIIDYEAEMESMKIPLLLLGHEVAVDP
jgi:hypothetical protein